VRVMVNDGFTNELDMILKGAVGAVLLTMGILLLDIICSVPFDYEYGPEVMAPYTMDEHTYGVGSEIASIEQGYTYTQRLTAFSFLRGEDQDATVFDALLMKKITKENTMVVQSYIYKGIIGNSKIINDQYYNSSEIDVGGAYVLVISKVNPDSSIVGEWKLKEGED
jgi:hypothetical protein